MFEKIKFSKNQVADYYNGSKRDSEIASKSDFSEVKFRFSYDALLKLAIAVSAENGLRIKSRRGHHIELIKKLAELFNDPEIELIGNEMRMKRNQDLYSTGVIISNKEAEEYSTWVKSLVKKGKKYFK